MRIIKYVGFMIFAVVCTCIIVSGVTEMLEDGRGGRHSPDKLRRGLYARTVVPTGDAIPDDKRDWDMDRMYVYGLRDSRLSDRRTTLSGADRQGLKN